MIIALEGIDASGKETQARLLAERAQQSTRFKEARVLDFPQYETLTGRCIKAKLQAGISNEDEALELQALFTVNRLEQQAELFKFARSPDNLLVLDRYWLSGLVYGASDGLPVEWLTLVHMALIQPALWFLIDITVDESKRRRPTRLDYYEKNFKKLETIREMYLNVFRPEEGEQRDGRRFVIDGMQNPAKITDQIWSLVVQLRDKIAQGLQRPTKATTK